MRPVYHFTNIGNLPGIIQHGLKADTNLQTGSYINSGNQEIKLRRQYCRVPFGGVVANYVPFYFAPRSPMMYVQYKNNYINNNDIIYLVSEASYLAHRYNWCCTNKNAAIFDADFFNTLEEMENNISWDVMNAVMWNNTDTEPDRRARRMAEFLVYQKVEFVDIQLIAVYSMKSLRTIKSILGESVGCAISVEQSWYY